MGRFEYVCIVTHSLREGIKHWTVLMCSILSFPWTLSHTLKCMCLCVCVSLPQWDSHDRGRWVRETGQSEMCRSPFPVPNGKHSPAVQPRMSEELHKSFSWYFNSSLFTQAAGRLHQVKLNTVDVLFTATENGLKWKICDTESNCRPVVKYCNLCVARLVSKLQRLNVTHCIDVPLMD